MWILARAGLRYFRLPGALRRPDRRRGRPAPRAGSCGAHTLTQPGPFLTEFGLTSAYGRRHLRVGREPAARLFGIGEFAVDGDLEHTTSRLVQRHLRAWRCPLNQTSRRTGARFVASHATIFDLDLHELSPDLMKAPYMGELDASINPTWANVIRRASQSRVRSPQRVTSGRGPTSSTQPRNRAVRDVVGAGNIAHRLAGFPQSGAASSLRVVSAA
jgi:hypothetical protein